MDGDSLKDRWVFLSDGDTYNAGQITAAVGTDYYLVRMRPSNGEPPSSQLFSTEDFCSNKSQEQFVCIFETEAELDAWVQWVNEDASHGKLKVVSIRNPNKGPEAD